jgi:hypothetical protein
MRRHRILIEMEPLVMRSSRAVYTGLTKMRQSPLAAMSVYCEPGIAFPNDAPRRIADKPNYLRLPFLEKRLMRRSAVHAYAV